MFLPHISDICPVSQARMSKESQGIHQRTIDDKGSGMLVFCLLSSLPKHKPNVAFYSVIQLGGPSFPYVSVIDKRYKIHQVPCTSSVHFLRVAMNTKGDITSTSDDKSRSTEDITYRSERRMVSSESPKGCRTQYCSATRGPRLWIAGRGCRVWARSRSLKYPHPYLHCSK
jgi:hypothetical protein